jgi:ABC-type multidrug transport system fused ATPase/permease subunit
MCGVPIIEMSRRATLDQQLLFALSRHRALFVKLTLSVVGYSVGHALLGLSAGAVAGAWGKTPIDHAVLPGVWSLKPSIEAASYVGLGAAIVKAATGMQISVSEKRVGAAVSGRLRLALVRHFLASGTGMPAPSALGLMAVRLREIEDAVIHGVLGRARSLAQLVPLALCLVVLSPKLALAAAAAVTSFGVLLASFRRRLRSDAARAQSTVESLESGVDELVRHVDLFRAYGAGRPAMDAVARSSSEATELSARLDGSRALASGFNEVMAAFAVVGVVALAGRFGLPVLGTALLPFAAVFFMAYRPMRDLGDARAWIVRGSVALDALSDAWRVEADEPAGDALNESSSRRAFGAPPEIVLVDFGGATYGATATLSVARGEVVCIIGPTGIGKTTLFRAMLGLEPARGRAVVGGTDVTHAPSGPALRPFAWVPQEATLVTATLVDNVALFGRSETAHEALRLVGAESIAGPDEIVGPGGRPLSGGERRLLALARAFASELSVLLLDEPTEGLDADSTKRVLDAIGRLRGRRSILIATHRSEVLTIADRVVRLAETDRERIAAE